MMSQGIQVRRLIGIRITVTLPTFKNPRNGVMQTAIVLPLELFDAIGARVAHAYDTLGAPTLLPDIARSVTKPADVS